MAGLSDLKSNPPVAMTMGAFAGIAWFICTELIVLFITTFKRYRGLYFWSCLLSSLGVILHPLTILMADFGIWTNLKVSITLIVLTWVLMVIPHSFVLYSRLHLVMHSTRKLRWIFYMIVINSIVMTPPTIVLGILAQASALAETLFYSNMIWNQIQSTMFAFQEFIISAVYVWEANKHIKNYSLFTKDGKHGRNIMIKLIYINIFVIFLDLCLVGTLYGALKNENLFYVSGILKPCIYGIKLRLEFTILNQLRALMKQNSLVRPVITSTTTLRSKSGSMHHGSECSRKSNADDSSKL